MMTDEKKITILEKMILDRNEQIIKLHNENRELHEKINAFYRDMDELKDIVNKTNKLNKEFEKTNTEMKKLKNKYKRDMRKIG